MSAPVSPGRFQQPALMFAVKGASVRHRSDDGAGVASRCLQQEAGPKTTVEQALMRGLTHDRGFVWGRLV